MARAMIACAEAPDAPFRLVLGKDAYACIRVYSRPGNDLTYRFPLIVDALPWRGASDSASPNCPAPVVILSSPSLN
jgi:hypothetical protein